MSYAQWTEMLEAKVGELRPAFGMEVLEWARRLGPTRATKASLLTLPADAVQASLL